MSYLSNTYLFLILPVVIVVYSLFPKKCRWVCLLVASYLFFYMISGKLLACLLFTTLHCFVYGLLVKKYDDQCSEALLEENVDKKEVKKKYKHKKKVALVISIFIQVGLLFVYKYMPFFLGNVNTIVKWVGLDVELKIHKLIAPIGLSFYTLEALAYMVDVYQGKIEGEKKIHKLALFLAFFPQIMEGPIDRYDGESALFQGNPITYEGLCYGCQRILYGLLKKIVIADRLNSVVKCIFAIGSTYTGFVVFFGAVCYTVMLYMEFSGTMDVILGSAEIFGIKLPENFRQPFFSKNISEFWSRWHITLGAWLKDYIFYPVSLSKGMKGLTVKMRKKLGNQFGPLVAGSVALLCVWLLNGLWHGAGWNYIFFGMYHFALILFGNVLEPVVKKLADRLKIDRTKLPYRILQGLKLFILVVIGELFFRAETLSEGFRLFGAIFENFTLKTIWDGSLMNLGLDIHDFAIIGITLVIVFVMSVLKEKGMTIRETVAKKSLLARWVLYLALILFIVIFGAYGPGYKAIDPIYANY